MKIVRQNDTIQIEICVACQHNCSNCTRCVGHYGGKIKHWEMDFETFKRAVDSLVGFKSNQGVGLMGGDPILHSQFENFARYAAEKLGSENLGLWSCFPKFAEEKMLHLGKVIYECFGTVFANDHSRGDVVHSPFLVSIEECVEEKFMWYQIEHCWAWQSWSASINPHGAYFCEIAASMAALFNDGETAWPIEPGWWYRVPKDYVAQMEKWCPKCGGALCGPMAAEGRYSNEHIDDVSPGMLERLKQIDSPKVRRGEFAVHDLKPRPEARKMASYKDENYRQQIVRPYGLFLSINSRGFMAPFLKIT
jgi:hypothetical protein